MFPLEIKESFVVVIKFIVTFGVLILYLMFLGHIGLYL